MNHIKNALIVRAFFMRLYPSAQYRKKPSLAAKGRL